MALPAPAPIPPASIRLSIAPEEWEACLESWLILADLNLRLPSKEFLETTKPGGKLFEFLRSYYHEASQAPIGDTSLHEPSAQRLKKTCFLLVHRMAQATEISPGLIDFSFWTNFSHIHKRSSASSKLIDVILQQHGKEWEGMVHKKKSVLLKSLGSSTDESSVSDLHQLGDLMRTSPGTAALFMTGSDFLDGLITSYDRSNSVENRKAVVAVTYLGLQSLVKIEPPNISLQTDHLYSLKAAADGNMKKPSLLNDLVTNTPLLSTLKRTDPNISTERLRNLVQTLDTYRSPNIARQQKQRHRKSHQNKGKGRSLIVNDQEFHVHRMSLVTQVQELFPDLGSGYVLKLLDEYDNDVEQVTAHLLDDSLPTHLRDLDRTEQAPIYVTNQEAIDHLEPRSTPPLRPFIPERRNVFDDDELDHLEMDTAKLHIGKRESQLDNNQSNKAAILSALAAFDSDDDERDDTYDVEDVGGTVDTAHPDGEPGPVATVTNDENDMALFGAYKSNPELFGRTFDIRKGQARQALKAETRMTDEAIEGWAIMLQRDPKRLKRLEAQVGSFDGRQAGLVRTAWRESPAGTETEDSDVPAGGSSFRGRGRGRGRGGRSRGGAVAGPSSDPSTAAAQRRKEANKGSRANHNRRDQRAKKMARGGFAG